MKINKYFPFAFLYFFLNSLALPFGLTYTALFAPFFYAWIVLKTKKEIILPFLVILCPFIIIQLLYSTTIRNAYFYSLFNLILVYIFCCAVWTFLQKCSDVEEIFRKLLVMNFVLCLVACVLYFTPLQHLVWIEQNITEGVNNFKRLKLFTYEASYYAILMVPLFCFYLLQYLFKQNAIKGWILLSMIFLPYVLSLSFGVIAVIFLSGAFTYLIYFRSLTRKRRVLNGVVFTSVILLAAVLIVYIFFTDSFLSLRLSNILAGNDSSGKGRTSDAFILANKLLQKRDEWWGVGLGQIKIMGTTIIRKYYMYGGDFVARIPNAAAETLATFGWAGFILRLCVEFFFFLFTKPWMNYYRLWLFLFIFIYQFTGSFITNVAEYVIWIFAFTNVFYQFDARSERKSKIIRLSPLRAG